MPKVNLRQSFVDNPPIPQKPKIDYFDSQLTGFLLEVRSSGTCTYYLRYRDKSSRLRQVRIGSSKDMTLEEARSQARALKSQAVIGFDPRAEQEKLKAIPRFRDFVYKQYIPHVKGYKRSWKYDQTLIEQRMIRIWGHKKLSEITTQDMIQLQSGLLEGGLAPASVNRIMSVAKYVLNLAERWEIIDKAPTRKVRKLEVHNHKERYLTPEEMQRLLDALDTSTSQVVPDIIRILILTGSRCGEVVGLRWEELDLTQGTWRLPPERNKAKKYKVIPLSNKALDLLRSRQGNGSEYVFPNPETGEPYQHFHGTWDRIRKKALLEDVRLHDLRHDYASRLVNSGRSLYEVQKLLGHSDISTTQRYAHLSDETLKDATEIACRQVGILKVKNGE